MKLNIATSHNRQVLDITEQVESLLQGSGLANILVMHSTAALVGQTLTLPYREGKLQLGTWQRLALIELDGPRNRDIALTCIG